MDDYCCIVNDMGDWVYRETVLPDLAAYVNRHEAKLYDLATAEVKRCKDMVARLKEKEQRSSKNEWYEWSHTLHPLVGCGGILLKVDGKEVFREEHWIS